MFRGQSLNCRCPAADRDPERVSGTRVPVSAIFENLENGGRIDRFIEWFPKATIEQMRVVLDHAAKNCTLSHVVCVACPRSSGHAGALRKLLGTNRVETALERGSYTLTKGQLRYLPTS